LLYNKDGFYFYRMNKGSGVLKKFSLIVTLILILAIKSIHAEAHTGLESSTPSNGEVMKKSLHEIVLKYESAIEPLSSLTLYDKNKKEIPLQGVTVQKNVMSASISAPLNNGTYNIHWKIVGKDGHPVEGDIPFEIEQAKEKQAVKPANEIKKDSPQQKEAMKQDNNDKAAPVFTYIIIGLAVLLILGFLLMRKKR
jgi:copper resistance protein C